MIRNQPRTWDWQLISVLLIACAVLIPRGVAIAIEHSACWDDDYHLYRGLLLLRGSFTTMQWTSFNDPPVGEALSAIPALLNGVHLNDPIKVFGLNPAQPPPPDYCFTLPDSIRIETAIWKSILFLPLIAVVFVWLRGVYSLASARLAVALILVEPTMAAHIPLPTVDVLGMEGIVIGCWASWRFVQLPSAKRAVIAGACIALGMVIKHTAALLPAAALGFAAVDWLIAKRLWKSRETLWNFVMFGLLAAVMTGLFIWVFNFFDMAPVENWPYPIPAGTYWRSLQEGMEHAQRGHDNFLWGQSVESGWWYYFPVVATYKIPIGIFFVMALAVVSLRWCRPMYQEMPFILAAAGWMALLVFQHIDIGFRHFLPVEIFLLMLASRCLVDGGRIIGKLAWAAIAVTAVELAIWTPDYLSYINFPRTAVYLDISDSNLDWGQGLKQLRKWMDALPANRGPVYFGYFGPIDRNLYTELGPRLMEYSLNACWMISPDGITDPVTGLYPDHGILVLSPVALTGQYAHDYRFWKFRKIPPNEVIGHSLLVYDLDKPSVQNHPSTR